MRTLRRLLLAVLTVALLATTAYAAGMAVRHLDATPTAEALSADGEGTVAAEPVAGTDRDDTTRARPAPPERTVAPAHKPFQPDRLLEPGDTSMKVRELQHRLFQIAWFPERTTGRYDAATEEAVRGFQAKRGFEATGVVDTQTWRRLKEMTDEPTRDQKRNVWHPGPRLLGPGASGEEVRELQARLVSIAWLDTVDGSYDDTTTEAVRGFQAKRGIPVTGEVDQRTRDRLEAMTVEPSYGQMHPEQRQPEDSGLSRDSLDPRCLTGRVLCVDKTTRSLRWMIDGEVLETVDVRFGREELPTREGTFDVNFKSRDHVSSIYHTSMPLALFFSGGQAVHYSPDFAANGYNGRSHGCVNVRDHDAMAWIFDQVRVGDAVIVYRS